MHQIPQPYTTALIDTPTIQAHHGRMYAPKPYRDAVRIQTLLLNDLEAEETTPAARAQLARAWDCLEERKRVMKMKPAPKPIDTTKTPANKPAKSASAPSFSESGDK